MNKNEFKSALNLELDDLKLSEICKNNIKSNQSKHQNRNSFRVGITLITTLFMCFTTVYAGYYIHNKIQVNDEIIPGLDHMKVIDTNEINGKIDENTNFLIEKEYSSYEKIEKDLGISLLKSDLATENPYFKGELLTSIDRDFVNIKVQNYIIGDITKFEYLDELDLYNTSPGKDYHSTISLAIDIITTEEALKGGEDIDYMGMYKFKESYTSKDGYKVNIVEDTVTPKDSHSEKNAIFVADGIRYTLKGRVSTELLKNIVDSMN